MESIPTVAEGKQRDTVGWGISLWILSTVVAYLVLAGTLVWLPSLANGSASVYVVFQVGLWQWIYVLPLLLVLRFKGKLQAAKGMLITAAIVSGLDALCSGLLLGK